MLAFMIRLYGKPYGIHLFSRYLKSYKGRIHVPTMYISYYSYRPPLLTTRKQHKMFIGNSWDFANTSGLSRQPVTQIFSLFWGGPQRGTVGVVCGLVGKAVHGSSPWEVHRPGVSVFGSPHLPLTVGLHLICYFWLKTDLWDRLQVPVFIIFLFASFKLYVHTFFITYCNS